MFFRLFLMAGCLACICVSVAPDMFGILNILYLKVNPDLEGDINQKNMATIYSALDIDGDNIVSKAEYIKRWTGLTEQSEEIATGYFEISDRDHDGQVTGKDSDAIFKGFDLDHNGMVSKDEFISQYARTFHIVPFIVLMNRVKAKNNVTGDISKHQFQTLFESLGVDDDGSISKATLETAWVKEHFGTKGDAINIMTSLDTNKDDVISKAELGARFATLDKNGMVQFRYDVFVFYQKVER